jgi:glycosyltransferase involved in cell wall biosynthesis
LTALVVCSDLPYPPRSGNHLRYLQNLRILRALGFDVCVIAAATRPDAATAGVGPDARLVETVPAEPLSTSARQRLRRVLQLMRSCISPSAPGPGALAYVDSSLDARVREVTLHLEPDLLLLRSSFGHLLPDLRGSAGRIVLDVHDSVSLEMLGLMRVARPSQMPSLVLRLLAGSRSDAMARYADELWLTTRREITYFARRAPDTPAVLVPNGIEVAPQLDATVRRTNELLLVGGFGYPPNVAAARALVEEILPRVRIRHPDVSVALVGRDLPTELLDRWRPLPVTWHGVVPDVTPYLRRAALLVFAPPSGAGAGSPLKVAEALAQGTAVATTPTGARGLELVPGRHALISSTPAELADAISQLLDDPRRRDAMVAEGHRFALEHLSLQRILERVRRESVAARIGP